MVPLGRVLDTSGRPIPLGNFTNDTIPNGPAFFIQVQKTTTTTTTTSTSTTIGLIDIRVPTVEWKYWTELFSYQHEVVTSKTYHTQKFDGKSLQQSKTVETEYGPKLVKQGIETKEVKRHLTQKTDETVFVEKMVDVVVPPPENGTENDSKNSSIRSELQNVSSIVEREKNITTVNTSYETLYKLENVTTITEENIFF
jgi:hypothetical protein